MLHEEVERYVQAGDLATAVCTFVQQRDHVTFAELEDTFGAVTLVKGAIALHLPGHENIILWAGLSQEWADLLGGLFKAHRLYLYPSTALVYMIDGKMLTFPLAKSLRQYKTEHWAPVTMRVVPPEQKRKGAA